MYNVEYINGCIGGISGCLIQGTKKGTYKYKCVQEYGSIVVRECFPMKYNKDGLKILVINDELSKEVSLISYERKNLVLIYQNRDKIVCDPQIKTRDGWVS